ncbi:MAG: glycine cleavage system protein H [Dehalococcoidia bacterium]
MVIALVVLSILALVAVDVLLSRRERGLAAEGAAGLKEAVPSVLPRSPRLEAPSIASLPEGLHYHPGHTWARTVVKSLAAVGIDELGGKVIGKVDGIRLPKVGEEVQQGKAAWTITHKNRTVSLVSPVTGVVVEVNKELERDPGLINKFPYTKGWVFKTQIARVKEDLKNLFTGASARKMTDLSKVWICFSFSPPSSYYQLVTYQDGGELVEDIGDRLNDDEWEKLKKEIFLSD